MCPFIPRLAVPVLVVMYRCLRFRTAVLVLLFMTLVCLMNLSHATPSPVLLRVPMMINRHRRRTVCLSLPHAVHAALTSTLLVCLCMTIVFVLALPMLLVLSLPRWNVTCVSVAPPQCYRLRPRVRRLGESSSALPLLTVAVLPVTTMAHVVYCPPRWCLPPPPLCITPRVIVLARCYPRCRHRLVRLFLVLLVTSPVVVIDPLFFPTL